MSKFQIILLSIFGACIIGGLILLATYKSANNGTSELPEITIWGTIPAVTFDSFIAKVNLDLGAIYKIKYVEKKESDFNSELVETLARGEAPDAVLIPHDLVMGESDKFLIIPRKTFNSYNGGEDLSKTFIEEAGMFSSESGVLAIPFSVNPLMMYLNTDMLTSAGIALEPKYWNDLAPFIESLTKKDENQNILRSAVALGEYRNILNAKEIFSALLMQAGDKISIPSDTISEKENPSPKNRYKAVIGTNEGAVNPQQNSSEVLRFYGDFSNPTKKSYTWNRSLPNSKNYFIGGNLAIYFGFASEHKDIAKKNPNLNFSVSTFPQINGALRSTFGEMYFFALPKAGKNTDTAFAIVMSLLAKDIMQIWSEISYLPSIRRDIISEKGNDLIMNIFNNSALISRAWVDPNPIETSRIIQNLIEGYASGSGSADSLINKARQEIQKIIDE